MQTYSSHACSHMRDICHAPRAIVHVKYDPRTLSMALSVESMCKNKNQEWYMESCHELCVSGMPLTSVFHRWMCDFVTHRV